MAAGKDTVVFGGLAGGAVLLDAFASGGQITGSPTVAVNTLNFTTTGYVLGGSAPLRFVNNGGVGGTITVASGVTATINNGITGAIPSGALTSNTTNADGAVDTNVDINGGGLLRLGGSNGSLGFNISGNTTVEVTGGSFSGFNLSTINAGSTLRPTADNVIPPPSSLTGGGTYDLNGFANITSTVGGAMSVTNSTSTASTTLNLSLNSTTGVHSGVISNGAGKTGLNTIGTLTQGNNFNTSQAFVTQTFAGSNTYTGSTSHGRGTLSLDFSNAAAPASSILYNGVTLGSLSGDDGKLILTRPLGTTATGQVNGLASSFTTFNFIGKAAIANSQAFAGFRLDAGAASQINVNPGNNGTLTLDLGTSLDRAAGSFVNFSTGSTVSAIPTATLTNTLTFSLADAAKFAIGMTISGTNIAAISNITAVNYTTGVVTLNNAPSASVTTAATGVGGVSAQLSGNATVSTASGTANALLTDATGTAFAIIGNRDWAAKNSANTAIVPVASATTTAAYTTSTVSGIATTPTAGGAGNDVRLGADTTISALRYANSGARIGINLGGNTLTTGGILINPLISNSGNTIGNGIIKPAGSDLVIINSSGNARYFGIFAVLANGTAGSTGLTTGGTNSLLLSGNNTFTGPLEVGQNGVILTGTNTPSAININGSTVVGMGNQLPGTSPTAAFVQLGNATATGSIGSANINLGINAIFAIKRTDAYTLNSNTNGLGGITQGWSGTTTLLSAATAKYAYAGDTTVTAGTLKLDYAASDTGIISDSSRLVLGGGTVEYATISTTANNDAVRDTILISGASTITKSGSGAGRLRLNSINSLTTAGSTLNLTAAGIADTDTNNSTAGILGSAGRFTVGSGGTYDWAFSAASGSADTAITAISSYTALTTASGNNLQALTATASLAADLTANSLKLTNTSASSQILDIGATRTLTLTSGGLLITGADPVQINNGTLRSNTASASDLIIHQYNNGGLTIGAVVANGINSSTLTKSGDGVLTLIGTNLYTGQTFIIGGKLSISGNTNLGLIGAGNVNVTTSATTSTAVTLTSATLPAGFGVGSSLLGQSVTSISGTAGTLAGNANTATNSSNALAFTSGSGITLNNGTLLATASFSLSDTVAGTRDRGITLNGVGGTIEVDSTRTLVIPAAITGPGGFTKTGLGTLEVRSNSFTGPTTVTAGTLKLGAAVNNIYSSYNVGGSGTLDIGGFANAVGALEGSGIVTNSGVSAAFSFGAFSTDSTFSGQFNQVTNALTLEKYGSGTFSLTSGTHSFTGTAFVSGGVFALSGAGSLPDTNQVNVNSAAGTFNISAISAASETIGSLAGVAGSSVILGSKNLTLGGTGSTTFAGVLSGTGGLVSNRSATATQILSGTNTYDGITTITTGVLQVNSAGALGSTVGNTVINSTGSVTSGSGTFGGQLLVNGGITIAENITVQGSGDANNFARAISATTGTNAITGTIRLTDDKTFRIGVGSGIFNLGLIERTALAGGAITFDPSAAAMLNINTALDNNLGNITAHGGGTVSLNASNNDIGDVTVQNSTTLRVGATNALNTVRSLAVGQGSLANGGTTAGGDIGTLQLAGVDQIIDALNGYPNAAGVIAPSANRLLTNTVAATLATLTVGNGNSTGSFDGLIQNGTGTTAFSKVGSGNQTLTGTVANTYTGATNVSGAGTLFLNSAISGTASLTIGTGSKVQLGAADRINNAAFINLNGGTLLTGGFNESAGILTLTGANVVDLGASASVLNFANSSSATWGSGSTLQVWNWSGLTAGGGTDQVSFDSSITPGLTAGQLLNVSFLDPFGPSSGTYGAALLPGGELVPVPEPTALLTAVAALAAALHRRARC